MAVSLTKGEKVNLSKIVERLASVTVGLGWDMAHGGSSIDCDSSVFVLKKSVVTKVSGKIFGIFGGKSEEVIKNKIMRESDIVYYGNLRHSNGCINHRGDNLVGGMGKRNDDEQIAINLKDMPEDVQSLVVVVNIYNCRTRNQHFGMINHCYARIVDDSTKEELCRYDLTDDYKHCTALIVGELYRKDGEWHFEAIGEGTKDGSIKELAHRYE